MLLLDEDRFSRDAIMNFHKIKLWCDTIIESYISYQFSLNICIEIIEDLLIRPVFVPSLPKK